MGLISPQALALLRHPGCFIRRVWAGFGRNQGLLMAGAVAYYALLSVVPLLALVLTGLSRWLAPSALLQVSGRYLEWLVPGQSAAFLGEVAGFLDSGVALHAVLLLVMLFFSSLAFSVLEKAMGVIFAHRRERHHRPLLVSWLLPYLFVFILALVILLVTLVSVVLQALVMASPLWLQSAWGVSQAAGVFYYLLGLGLEWGLFSVIYWILPVGRTRLHHAMMGGAAVAFGWELLRHALVWYFVHLSRASLVYGSLAGVVLALFSLEFLATLLLLGAQVIAEYEQWGRPRAGDEGVSEPGCV